MTAPIAAPDNIWGIENNLKVHDEREGGQFMTHINYGDGPFKVIQYIPYSEDARYPGFPWDAYYKIEIQINGIWVEGWVIGVDSGHWKVSYTKPIPLVPPVPPVPPIPPVTPTWQYAVTIDPVTGAATIVKL